MTRWTTIPCPNTPRNMTCSPWCAPGTKRPYDDDTNTSGSPSCSSPLGVQDMLGASDGRIYLVATQGFTTHAQPDLAPYTRIRVD